MVYLDGKLVSGGWKEGRAFDKISALYVLVSNGVCRRCLSLSHINNILYARWHVWQRSATMINAPPCVLLA